jgi:hypothetical protein
MLYPYKEIFIYVNGRAATSLCHFDKSQQNGESHEWDCHESPNSLRIGPAGAKGGELFSESGLHCFFL